MRSGSVAFLKPKILSPVIFLVLAVLFSAGAIKSSGQQPDAADRLLSKLESVKEMSFECVKAGCPDADRPAMQQFLNELEDAQLLARLTAFWLTQLPAYGSSSALQERVTKLRRLHNEIRNLIYDESDGKASLMRCVVKLNEARGEGLAGALIDFDRNTGKDAMPQWVWESVQMFGNSLALDSTETPEKAGEALKVLDPLMPEAANGIEPPTIGATVSKLSVARERVEQNGNIEIQYELSPCLRNPRLVLVPKGSADRGAFNPSTVAASRNPGDENPGSIFLGAPRVPGVYEVRILNRETDQLLPEKTEVTVLGFRVTNFPGIYAIRRSTDNAEIGTNFAIVADDNGNHFWGIVVQTPGTGEWNFRKQRFEGEEGEGRFVAPAELAGGNLRILRSFGYCREDGKGIPTKSELILSPDGKSLTSRYQTWNCTGGEPALNPDQWALEFEAEKVSSDPPAIPRK